MKFVLSLPIMNYDDMGMVGSSTICGIYWFIIVQKCIVSNYVHMKFCVASYLMMNYGGMGMVGPSMVSRDLLVRHLHGLCCVAFHDNELICGLCCGGKDFILC